MAAASNYLAFDLGASSGRAVLGSLDGGKLTLREMHRFDNGPVQLRDRLCWDVLGLFTNIKTGLAKCAEHCGQLNGIGIDTWGVDFGLLSPAGELLGLPVHYRDARTKGMMDEALRRAGRELIYAKTGIQFMELNTLYQLLSVSMTERAMLAAADTLLFMPDLLGYWLTGTKRSEHSIASTSQLYDVGEHAWAGDLFEKLELPIDIMPEVASPGTVLGDLLPSVAEEVGLSSAPVIAPACHDTGSAVAGVPAHGDGWAYISSGTWSLVGVEVPDPIRTPEALAQNFTNEGGAAGRVRFLKNVAGLWLVQECKRTWDSRGESRSFAELAELASSSPPLVSFVDPDDARFGEPGDMPRRIQDFCAGTGQAVPQTPGAVVRCALESLALKYRRNIDLLDTLTGSAVGRIHLVGGGINNRLLCQFTADACQRPVIAGPAEATAAGNVMVQALARGDVSSLDEVRQVIADSTRLVEYEPTDVAAWSDAHRRFERLLPAANRA